VEQRVDRLLARLADEERRAHPPGDTDREDLDQIRIRRLEWESQPCAVP
jgi:hypothetical protein